MASQRATPGFIQSGDGFFMTRLSSSCAGIFPISGRVLPRELLH